MADLLDNYDDDILIDSQQSYYNAYPQNAYNELLDDIENAGQFANNNNNNDMNDMNDNLDEFPLRAEEANNGGDSGGISAQFSSQILDDDGTFPLVSFVNSLSCWHLPTLDHSSWFCIGIYIILMVVIPFIKDGSTSIIFALNIPIFILYCAWYRWFADTSVKYMYIYILYIDIYMLRDCGVFI